MIFKFKAFNTLQDFYIDFKSTLSKLDKSSKLISKDLQTAVFLHGVEKTYSQWAFAKQSIIQDIKIDDSLLTVDKLTVKFIDKLQTNI